MIDPSMMGGGPPPSISIPGGGGEQPAAAGNTEKMQQVKDLLRDILDNEPDQNDSLLIEKMLTEAQQYMANEEKLVDTATGAGPGAKLMRKAGSGGSEY